MEIEFEDSSLRKLTDSDRHIAAMDKIASLVMVRERTDKELYRRLLDSDFTDAEASEAVDRAVEVGLVSNERYAIAFIKGKSSKGWGREKIVDRLRMDGVSEIIIDSLEDEFRSENDEYESAVHELEKRPCRSSNPYASLMRRLLSKGYSKELSHRVVREYLSSLA